MSNQKTKLNEIDSNNNELTEINQCDHHKSVSMSISLADNNSKKILTSNAGMSSSSTVSSMSSYNGFKSHEKENHFEQPASFDSDKPIKYGELVVLGYNGCINHPSVTDDTPKSSNVFSKRRRSKFILQPRDKPTGVKPAQQFNCHNKQDFNNVFTKNDNHSVTYTLSRTHQVIVKYVPDEKTDMFQIGRSTESAIDFIVLDTQVPQHKNSSNETSSLAKSTMDSDTKPSGQSTISRYSCRISVDREYPYHARIFAAGFDSSKRIFLGEKATKWKNDKDEFDGVTTNGVLIMHPSNGFNYSSDNNTKNEWMEVSVCGAVFNLDENRLTPCLGTQNLNSDKSNKRSNILRDGTLIDLCGATLLWRSTESLELTPTKRYLEMNLEHLNRLRPQCPVGFKTLVFPSSASPNSACHSSSFFLQKHNPLSSMSGDLSARMKGSSQAITKPRKHSDRIPMVYLKCGHIHGQHDWGMKKDNERECPLCRKVGPYVQLLIGVEPSFYCDTDSSSFTPFRPYAFIPCGHMASEETCRFWSRIKVPQGVTQGLSSLCPFCAAPLCKEQPIVKLILQEGL